MSYNEDLEADIRAIQKQRKEAAGVALGAKQGFAGDIDDSADYVTSIPTDFNFEEDDNDAPGGRVKRDGGAARKRQKTLSSFSAPQHILEAVPRADDDTDEDQLAVDARKRQVSSREDDYRARGRARFGEMPREKMDAFGGGSGDGDGVSYREIMMERQVAREEARLQKDIADKQAAEAEAATKAATAAATMSSASAGATRKRRRWDQAPEAADTSATSSADPGTSSESGSDWDAFTKKGAAAAAGGAGARGGASRWDAPTPVGGSSRWDAPTPVAGAAGAESGRSRWDETPVAPHGAAALMTPNTAAEMAKLQMTPAEVQIARAQGEMAERNRPLSDEELDAMLPSDGFRIMEVPANYVPIRNSANKLMATPTPMGMAGFAIDPELRSAIDYGIMPSPGEGLPDLKPEDRPYFEKLVTHKDVDEDDLTLEEAKEQAIMKLLLKIKNGVPSVRKVAMRQITEKAREFGADALFNQILPLLMSPTLEDQERHLLVKVIDRVMYKLDDLVRPHVHKILVVIEPLLIDEDRYARIEGREIISNLAKAAGLAHMIATMRPYIDDSDEYVRNTTARAFSVVASALGIPALIPFLRAVCASRKSWEARHTGIKIVQQIAILMGVAVLPHLKQLVDIIQHGLQDEQQKVRLITALALAALAEAAAPYGIESFDNVLKPLWYGIRQHRGKALAAFLKAIGFIIPLMDPEYASYYTKEVMVILIREFASTDPDVRKIVLQVVKQCVSTEGVEAQYVRDEVLPDFFKHFWVVRTSYDRRAAKALVETTVELAAKVGCAEIVQRLAVDLKDEAEQYRQMVMEAVDKIVAAQGVSDIDQRLEEQLMDGVVSAFQLQTSEDSRVILDGFGTVVNALGLRVKAYLTPVVGAIRWRLNNRSAKVRQHAADLIARIAKVMQECGEEQMMGNLGMVLYEYLGEEYPDVLGSILGALRAIVSVIGMHRMTPPVKDLLPRLTPILKNRHEKVQENCIDLVGRIADRAPDYVSAREWMRICFELLELLKARKKSIRRAAVSTFGYIARAIGPQDVLATLLNNLKVQERQNRVCTTVAIAIVAETCAPFTVLPALLNEYRVPSINVQNGVLKSLSFMFEYIGEMAKDYINAVAPLLANALTDKDAVHRQTAASAVMHLALGVRGRGCERALLHLLNMLWPNIFEKSPHVINAVMNGIEGLRVALGPQVILLYTLQGLFHPARRVREVYWKIYNTLYIASQPALVAAYPRIDGFVDKERRYRRDELEIIL